MILKEVKKFKIDTFRDNRGLLSFFSSSKNRFNIKRVYYIENNNVSVIRGKHSRNLGSKFYFCSEGKLSIKIEHKKKIKIINLYKGEVVKISSKFWIEIKFHSKSTRCIVFDNREYKEKEYNRQKT